MERTINTKFYTFTQNNSGGHFVVKEDLGIGEYVIIEALDYQDANNRFDALGINDYGSDCPCCGSRWSYLDSYDEGQEVPSIYDEPIENYQNTFWSDKKAFVHYFDKTIKQFDLQKK